MRKLSILLAATLALPAHAFQPPGTPVETITFRSGACFGRCPIYEVTVNSNGSATFTGINFTAVAGARPFSITAAQYRAFAAHLAPLRPAHGNRDYRGPPLCRQIATDMPSADVTWRSRRGEQRLHFYYGCDMEKNRFIIRRLSSAPGLLPIGDFIGTNR
jgi:hypothetical protein